MTENGSPRWLLAVFGVLATALGLYLWHRQGRYFGLGEAKGVVDTRAALVSLGLFLAVSGAELVRNVR